jgi:tetratricopeptide (TPR) repeat protein
MSDENKFAEIERLFNEKDYAGALSQLEVLMAGGQNPISEALGWAAWCHYRLGRFTEAMKNAVAAGEDQWALLCKLYLLADYRYELSGRVLCSNESGRIIDRLAVARAFVDFAGDQNYHFWRNYDPMLNTLQAIIGQEGVEVANLFRDAAQVYIGDPLGLENVAMALGLLEVAMSRYKIDCDGKGSHHLANLYRTKSGIFEKLGDIRVAEECAIQETAEWTKVLSLGGPDAVLVKLKRDEAWENFARLRRTSSVPA